MQTEILANDDILRLKFGVPRRVLARLSAEMKAALAQAVPGGTELSISPSDGLAWRPSLSIERRLCSTRSLPLAPGQLDRPTK
jgi:hypothetical protein